jgi:solute carrier family 35 protein E1
MGIDIELYVYLGLWYAGNYYYNIYNKLSSKAGGGTEFVMTLALLQMAVGAVYSLFLWFAPEARASPKMTFSQVMKLAPLGFCAAAAHAGAVFSLSAGAVSFAQIVKAAEPAFAAGVGYTVYGKTISKAKMACLVPIIGGIWVASVKELDFTWAALAAAGGANIAAAFRGQENKRTMAEEGLKEAVGGAGNTYAITTLWATLMLIPLVFITGEYNKLDQFMQMWSADGKPGTVGNLRWNTIMSGLTFYLYNEVSTIALKKISGVTHSVANTAKRAIIIVGCAIAFGESMDPIKMTGCAIAIGGTFLYAIADDLVKPSEDKTKTQ